MEQFCYKLGVILSNIAAMSEEYHSEVSVLRVCASSYSIMRSSSE